MEKIIKIEIGRNKGELIGRTEEGKVVLGVDKIKGIKEPVKLFDRIVLTEFIEKERFIIAKEGYFYPIKDVFGGNGRYYMMGGSYREQIVKSIDEFDISHPIEADRVQKFIEEEKRYQEEQKKREKQFLKALETAPEPFSIAKDGYYDPYILVEGDQINILKEANNPYYEKLKAVIDLPSLKKVKDFWLEKDRNMFRVYQREVKILTSDVEEITQCGRPVLKQFTHTWGESSDGFRPGGRSSEWKFVARFLIKLTTGEEIEYELVERVVEPEHLLDYIQRKLESEVKPSLYFPEQYDDYLNQPDLIK
jgi:hypothetical protein